MTDTAPPPARRRLRVGLIVLVALAVGYAVAWFVTAEVMKRQTAEFLEAQRAGGNTVTTGTIHAAGFPGRVRVVVPDLAIVAPVGGSGRSWQAPRVDVIAWPLFWRVLDLDLAGRHRVTGLFAPNVPAWIDAPEAGGRIVLDGSGRLTRASLDFARVEARRDESAAPVLRIAHARGAVELIESTPSPAPDAHPAALPVSARLRLEVEEVSGPERRPQPMVGPIARAVLAAEITGRLPAGPLPDVLEAWRAQGGTLEVREVLLDWPPLHIAGDATVALDPALQPTGAATLRMRGGMEALDLLARGGVVNDGDANLARAAIALMSTRNANGEEELSLPLSVQDRKVSAGPFAIGRIEAVTWPRIVVP